MPRPQLFTEYGRLAMDEIFQKPFQVIATHNISCIVVDVGHLSDLFYYITVPPTVFDVPRQGLELSL